MTSLDPGRTRAILLGASRGCRSLGVSDLRAPRTNLSEFRKVLQDEAILGLPDDNVLLRHEPSDSLRLLREVGEFAKGAEDTLIVYYTGHGLISGGFKELYLWIPEVEAIAEPPVRVGTEDNQRAVSKVRQAQHTE